MLPVEGEAHEIVKLSAILTGLYCRQPLEDSQERFDLSI